MTTHPLTGRAENGLEGEPPPLRARLMRGETLFGTLLSLPSPDVADLMARIGFDWLFVDGEHGAFDARSLMDVVRAAGRTPCLVRTPVGEDAAIARALDMGAAGVIVPQVHDAAQAARVAALAHHPPEGTRGVGVTRSNGFGHGPSSRGPLAAANDAVTVVVQAESTAALANIGAIARVEGVDAVLVGPNDLAASMGFAGQSGHPQVQEAIGRIVSSCQDAGRAVGIFGASAAAVEPWMARGVTLIVAGVDALLLGAAARALHDSLVAAASSAPSTDRAAR